jgi:hypothetical protein
MLGRRLAITFVKDKRKADDSTPVDTMPLDQIGENIVETVAGVGTVVVVVATTLTALRVTEHVVKYIFR